MIPSHDLRLFTILLPFQLLSTYYRNTTDPSTESTRPVITLSAVAEKTALSVERPAAAALVEQPQVRENGGSVVRLEL